MGGGTWNRHGFKPDWAAQFQKSSTLERIFKKRCATKSRKSRKSRNLLKIRSRVSVSLKRRSQRRSLANNIRQNSKAAPVTKRNGSYMQSTRSNKSKKAT